MNDPAVLFYTSDFLTGVMDMTMEERGQYITLLCYQHQKGHIEEKTIWLLVGSCSVNVLKHFKVDENGLYYNERMDLEKEKRHNYNESRRKNGKLGGRPKKEKDEEKNIKKSDWEEMLDFFDNTCVCCGARFENQDKPTKDHIIPQSWGGSDDICNLQPLCRECNASKCADDCNDYRKKYIADIPQNLKNKWFKSEREMYKDKKPYGYDFKNHMGNENINENINNNYNNNIYINNNINIYDFIEQNFARPLSPIEYELIGTWEDTELTRYAIKQAVLNGKYNLKYIDKIIDNYKKCGIITIQQAQEAENKFKKTGEIHPHWLDKKYEQDIATAEEEQKMKEMLSEFK